MENEKKSCSEEYIYNFEISVCLFVCPVITQEPLDRFVSILIEKLGKPTGMSLAWFKDSKLSVLTLIAKI